MPSYELFIGIDHAFSFPVTYFERYRLGLRRRPAAMQAMQRSLNEVCCVSGA